MSSAKILGGGGGGGGHVKEQTNFLGANQSLGRQTP